MHSTGLRILQRAAAKLSRKFVGPQQKLSNAAVFNSKNTFCWNQYRSQTLATRLFSSTAPNTEPEEQFGDNEETTPVQGSGSQKIPYFTPNQIYENADLLASITNGDAEVEKTLRILCLELEVMRQEGAQVPEDLTVESWQALLQLDSRNKRRKFYRFLFLKGIKKMNVITKKQARTETRLAELANMPNDTEDGHLKYGLMGNNIFLRIYDATMTEYENYRVIRAMQMEEQKIFIDCGFDESMSPQELKNLAKQLVLVFADNRAHSQPFDLYYCNAPRTNKSVKFLHNLVPTIFDTTFPLNITEKSYLDLVPKEKIVYLTPHCREELDIFDHDTTYIIGGIVDKSNQEPLTLAKAKREGIRMAKLPLDRYLHWASSSKSLTLDQMIKIMLDIKFTGDWNVALKHIPRRKVHSDEEFVKTSSMSKKNNPFSKWDNRDRYSVLNKRF